jgi:hypothetical protein
MVKVAVPGEIKSPSLDNNINVTTLHYALAAEVDGIRDRIIELREDFNQLNNEAKTPKPFQWGAFATILGVIFTSMLSVGALVERNISARIENIEKGTSYTSSNITDGIKVFNELHTKREDSLEARVTARIDEINNKMLQLLTLKAEFQSTIDAIHQRQSRDENYIDQNRNILERLLETRAKN